ncbi:hypothetical protein DSO57_1020307 [Entomophthora muscae]|uniref:Uncharacterized protein n=1 Tax=Entomophthora muscae TaxID=34485 RepID=A0ACC2RUU2_9FUNG|nr:hypothetical protein DSO57_1020307 [Entomophthora muscae]
MEPPVTPKPMPASAAKLPLDHTNKLFGIVYITLTGVIDTIVPAAGPWSWLGKSMSYLIKLAPILWWALPTQSSTYQFPDASEPASQGWFPDMDDEHHIAVTRETAPFSVMLKNLHSTIQGPVIEFPKFDIVLGLDWLQKNNPHVDWATLVLTIKREDVNHQIYLDLVD